MTRCNRVLPDKQEHEGVGETMFAWWTNQSAGWCHLYLVINPWRGFDGRFDVGFLMANDNEKSEIEDET
ncbi:hypothetical protein N7447_006937 [Penicillium robsamsonii]|uniref:uncharacterized protein n=1 Tax=Penicillium robsamsonii TaxID=1792511 RepID=UPI0025494586|nr:uncharacterized protein N7447_006937 [Penicillium robsamsonii]KAJ5824597.1 hypothetical protein N7447_006937 [Penicillium robsamsonii]